MKVFTLLDWGHENSICIVPNLTDDPRRESQKLHRLDIRTFSEKDKHEHPNSWTEILRSSRIEGTSVSTAVSIFEEPPLFIHGRTPSIEATVKIGSIFRRTPLSAWNNPPLFDLRQEDYHPPPAKKQAPRGAPLRTQKAPTEYLARGT